MRTTYKLGLAGTFFSFALAGCTFSPNNKLSPDLKSADSIIGGTSLQNDQEISKTIVAIYDESEGGLCTGTLISSNLVVTAAHCISSDPSQMYVYFGASLTPESPHFPVQKVEISPYWQSGITSRQQYGDIALIYFKGRIPQGFKPAQLINKITQRLLQDNAEVVVAGYGIADSVTGDGAGTLRQTTLKISDARFSPSEFLADQSGGRAACHGDSGGPVFLVQNGQYYFGGVISRGIDDPENTCSVSLALTRIDYYRVWIDRISSKLTTSLAN